MIGEKIRHILLNKIVLLSLFFVVLFSWMDAKQIQFVYNIKQVDKWVLYNTFSAPPILVLWYAILAGIAIAYYLFTKDKSESLALFAVPSILLLFGIEDLLFFVFSSQTVPACADWLSHFPFSWVGTVLGQQCPGILTMIITTAIGGVIAYFVFRILKKRF